MRCRHEEKGREAMERENESSWLLWCLCQSKVEERACVNKNALYASCIVYDKDKIGKYKVQVCSVRGRNTTLESTCTLLRHPHWDAIIMKKKKNKDSKLPKTHACGLKFAEPLFYLIMVQLLFFWKLIQIITFVQKTTKMAHPATQVVSIHIDVDTLFW